MLELLHVVSCLFSIIAFIIFILCEELASFMVYKPNGRELSSNVSLSVMQRMMQMILDFEFQEDSPG